jgi:hypothetical protein
MDLKTLGQVIQEGANFLPLVSNGNIEVIGSSFQGGANDPFDQGDSQNRYEGFAIPHLPESTALSSRDNQTFHVYRVSHC